MIMARKRVKFLNREDWLEARGRGIGASEVATIVGLNPYETPYQLWRRKMGIDPPKEMSFLMKAGLYLEDAISQFFADETGSTVIKSSATEFMYISKEKPHLRVSPDRTYWSAGDKRNEGNKKILECKSTQMNIDPDDLPKWWFCQLQMNLGVAQMQRGSLAWLVSGREFGYKEFSFVPDFFAWLTEEADRFWIDNIQGGKEPPAVTSGDVIMKYARHTDGKVIEADEATLSAYNELKSVRRELDALKERKAVLEDKIKLAFGDAEALTYGDATLATWKAGKDQERFDAKAFQTAHPDLYREFIKPVAASRRFLLK